MLFLDSRVRGDDGRSRGDGVNVNVDKSRNPDPIHPPDFLNPFCSWVQCRLNSYARKSALFRPECSTRRDELLGKTV